MRNIIFIGVMTLGISQAYSQSIPLSSYCNENFGFCIFYPSETFDQETILNEDKGTLLYSSKHQCELNITGHANTSSWTIEDLYYFYFEKKLTDSPQNQLLDLKMSLSNCTVESIIDGEKIYFEAFLEDGFFITIHLKVPLSLKENYYKNLRNSIGIANTPVEE